VKLEEEKEREDFYFWFSTLYNLYRFLTLHTKTVISSFLPPLYTMSKCSVAAKL